MGSEDFQGNTLKGLFLLSLLLVLMAIPKRSASYNAYLNTVRRLDWYSDLERAAKRWGIPSGVVLSHVFQESGGDPEALGSAGERGLLQIKQGALGDYNQLNHTAYTLGQLFDPAINLEVGVWYLSHLKKTFHLTLAGALLAFNNGIGNYRRGKIQDPEYAVDILARA